MILEVYDLECLSNLFTYTGYDIANKKWYQYVIHNSRNDAKELYDHLWNNRKELIQIGFNNLAYDYTLEHHFLRHFHDFEFSSGQELAQDLYSKSQEIIDTQFSEIADRNKFIKQIDLYKIWHYNNKARHQSLKGLEIQMRMDNVEEMPIHHSRWCSKDDIQCVLDYNKNDVLATAKFFMVTVGKTDYPLYKGKNKLQLRFDLNKKFNVDVTNMGDVPMGEELVLNLYSRASGINKWELKKSGGTPRPDGIKLKDCIPYWCDIKSKEFKVFLNKVKSSTITGAKGEFVCPIVFHNYKFDFAQGGMHGCCEPRVWESNDEWVIADYDIGSLYPSMAESLGLYPEHLGKLFLDQYVGFIKARLKEKHKPKEERDNVLIEGYKLILNGCYGKSNEDKSFLYDPMYTFRTTFGGEIFGAMWAERWVEAVPELKFLQSNTDGQTIYVPRKDLDKIRAVNDQLTAKTGLTIEEAIYSKMIIRDVNSYIAVYEDSTSEHEHIKLKGDYEVDKEYHKDPSMRIVPLAVKNYFVYGIPVEETIRNHQDIFDFCMQLKANSTTTPKYRHLNNDGKIVEDVLGRTTRYLVTTTGGILIKDFADGRKTGVTVGRSVTIFNKYVKKDMKDYNLDYNFYIAEAYKLVYAISDGQLNLFEDDLFY